MYTQPLIGAPSLTGPTLGGRHCVGVPLVRRGSLIEVLLGLALVCLTRWPNPFLLFQTVSSPLPSLLHSPLRPIPPMLSAIAS